MFRNRFSHRFSDRIGSAMDWLTDQHRRAVNSEAVMWVMLLLGLAVTWNW